MPQLIALAFWFAATWLIWRDTRSREGISSALWIPTLWAAILLSRSLSAWLGVGGGAGGVDSQEGSPLDRLFYFASILASIALLIRRRLNWGALLSSNWPLFLVYGYFLVSVVWADSPVVSFKRWFKDIGNVFVALVILTESNPLQAVRAVFVRSAYVLIPLSEIFLRYFPYLGRRYSNHSGGLEPIGVTMQKNSLGALVVVAGLVLVWDWLERATDGRQRMQLPERLWRAGVLLVGVRLLYLCDSKTSILCFVIGLVILLSIRMPGLRSRVSKMGVYSLGAVVVAFMLDQAFGLSEFVVAAMGRDMTFTGRTEVWAVLLGLRTDPLFGTGFYSFWSDEYYLAQLPDWVAFSAHNGYLETYLDGGLFGVLLLSLMLVVLAWRTNRQLGAAGNFALFRFTVLVVTLIANFSESHFFRMSPLAFLLFVSTLDATTHPGRVLRSAGTVLRERAGSMAASPVRRPSGLTEGRPSG
ncbi:Lipid A core - O-antigen ligase [Luteitalea pratensis]|uniref:Lipid A core-O-antigen ligase n=1 Tax=Luteitalea pratensis TaxID=1855912 RepID=A0A143PXM2_LUTPR|nr:O-antigen ligase family protein [Luteitalea pratensis]AMY12968.1 Lipid A core - O-antigen ligase [Luteitalea pratensis]